MSIKLPNWITENDWSDKSRLDWANQIMAFSSRDWSVFNNANGRTPDFEKWALWCLITSDTKEEAIKTWESFVIESSQKGGIK